MSTKQNHLILPYETAIEAMTQLKSLFDVLNEDLLAFNEPKDAIARRAGVRAFFAYVEGSCFGLRRAATVVSQLYGVELSDAEKLIVGETAYVLNDKGQIEERVIYGSTIGNVRFSMTLFAKAVRLDYTFPAGVVEFELLQKAQRIRNRLAHPRTAAELEVSQEEHGDVERAGNWLVQQQTMLLYALVARLVHGTDQMFARAEEAKTPNGYNPAKLLELMVNAMHDPKQLSLDEVLAFRRARESRSEPQRPRGTDSV